MDDARTSLDETTLVLFDPFLALSAGPMTVSISHETMLISSRALEPWPWWTTVLFDEIELRGPVWCEMTHR